MNKFQFINKSQICIPQKATKSFRGVTYADHEFQTLISFSSDSISNLVEDETRLYSSGRIVKSEIREKVTNQLKRMLDIVKEKHEEMLCLKMSKETRDLLRIYFSYEVCYIPKNLPDEMLPPGSVIGCIYGFRIIQDENLIKGIIQPVIKKKTSNIKFETLMEER